LRTRNRPEQRNIGLVPLLDLLWALPPELMTDPRTGKSVFKVKKHSTASRPDSALARWS